MNNPDNYDKKLEPISDVLDKVTPENIVRKIVKDPTNACKAEKSIKVINVNILIIYVNFYFIV